MHLLQIGLMENLCNVVIATYQCRQQIGSMKVLLFSELNVHRIIIMISNVGILLIISQE